ncbi:DUF5009 domain-containing protein [Pollutibacter soli]|uniref:DUF5009 domain-containing protein n=1 Tax=Pollutibacter soli TaxID=3034157 RepID=UPI0030140FA5
MPVTAQRIHAIDVFRAITMLFMIFVNDLWTLKDIPGWLGHTAADEDGMGLADVVFPCFLFIAGMSIPHAIAGRLVKGESRWRIFLHIIFRTIGLLVMGVFIVNLDNLNEAASGVSRSWYQILMFAGFILIWNVYPRDYNIKRYLYAALRLVGIGLLVFLFLRYRGDSEAGLISMRPQWWGILGLIGWAYFGNAVICLFFHRNTIVLIGAWIFFLFYNIICSAGWFIPGFAPVSNGLLIGYGAFHAFVAAGVVASQMLEQTAMNKRFSRVALQFVSIGVLLIGIGIFLRGFFIISKIKATPPWIFICSGIGFLLFVLIYFLTDIKQKSSWFSFIKAAGTATLTCYLLPYLFYAVDGLTGISLPEFVKTSWIGLLKSILFSWLIIYITSGLIRIGIRVRL